MNVFANSWVTSSPSLTATGSLLTPGLAAAEVVVPVRTPGDGHGTAGDQRLRPRHRGVLLGGGAEQGVIVVGPGLVVVVDGRHRRVAEDRHQSLQSTARAQLQPASAVDHPAAAPALLVLPAARVPLAGSGLDVVEPHVLDAGPVGPGLFAGDRAGVAPDALVEVHDHRGLGHDAHRQYSTVLAAPAHDGDLVALVAGGPVVVEAVRQLGVAADQMARLDQQSRQRVVDAAASSTGLRPGDVDGAVLGVVHEHGALRHPVRDTGSGDDDAVAVDRLDPLVVGHPDRGGILDAHPDLGAAPGQCQHEQVVLVLGVDRPLRVRGQVADRHLGLAGGGAGVGRTEDAVQVQRRPIDRQPLTELCHPRVVEEEVLPPGQGVPRFASLDVDGEGRVPPPAVLRAGPLVRGDDRHRAGLGVGEADLLALVVLGEVGQPGPGAVLEPAQAQGGQTTVRGARQRQDRLAGLDAVASSGRPSAIPPIATPLTRLSCSTSRSGNRVIPLTVVPSCSTLGPSAPIMAATAP